jgi:hemolysin activation/secretion protein
MSIALSQGNALAEVDREMPAQTQGASSPPIFPKTEPNQELKPFLGTITVSKFEFEGNTAFSDEELAAVTAPFTNRAISLAELFQAETAVTKFYTNAGYINSGAVIPIGQSFPKEGAVVKMQIVEGGIGEIRVDVEGKLNPNYVRSRLAIATKPPLNQNRLLEALQLLQLNPLIESISANLSAGILPQSSILSVKVKEADTFNLEIFTDNGRVPSIGSVERGVRLNQGNLLGFGDGLNLEYTNTEGSNTVQADYTIPINAQNGTVKLSTQFDDTKVVEEPFEPLDITGKSLYLDLSFRQPVVQTPEREVALGITLSRSASDTALLGMGFPLSPGASENGETRLSALRFFQEWTERGSQDILAVRSQFSLGVGALDATVNDEPPDSRFLEWRGQGQYVRLLAPDTLLILRSSFQVTTRPLIPLEQFALGGLYSVRGYRQDLLLTDNGVFTSAEVRLPLLRAKNIHGVLQLAPFVDFGVGWNNSANPIPTPVPNTLIALGLGLQWQMRESFTARLDWGIPLTEFEIRGETLQEQGLYFSLNYSFF